jgi:hypothetical protein
LLLPGVNEIIFGVTQTDENCKGSIYGKFEAGRARGRPNRQYFAFLSPVPLLTPLAMPTLKVTLSELTIREKIEFARRLAEAVPAYPTHFPSPPFPQIEVEGALRNLEIAYDAARLARMMARRKDEMLQEAEASLDQVLRQQIDYVESASRGNVSVLRSMGLGSRVGVGAGVESAGGPEAGGNEQWW